MELIPTDRELEALKVLWQHGEATVRDIYDRMNEGGAKLAYTTVLSLLQVMEQKGLVRHRQSGKAYLYAAEAERDRTFRTLAGGFLEKVFDGAVDEYLVHALRSRRIQRRGARPAGENDRRRPDLIQIAERQIPMNTSTASCAGSLVGWLADYYALATLLLLGTCIAWRWIRQPAHRLVIAWMLSGELIVLAVVCALPSWPRFALIAATAPEAVAKQPAVEEPPPLLARPPMPVAPEAEPEQVSVDSVKADAPEPPAVPVLRWPQLTGVQWIAVGYLAGAALVGLWLSWGAVATTWVRKRAWPAGSSLRTELSRVVPADGRMPRLLVSPQVVHAVALGVLRPTIVLPAGLAENGPPQTLRAVLAHEWAHIHHRDLWLLALGRFLLVALFAHPLFWWLRHAIRSDQELLADAVAAGDHRQQYAEELLAAVRRAARPTTMTLSAAVGIWEGSSQLSRRIAMLLDETFRVEPSGSRRWRVQALAWLVLAGAACSLVTLQPAPSTAEPAAAEAKPEPKAGPTDAEPADGGNAAKNAVADDAFTQSAPPAGNLTKVGGGALVLSGSNESTSATSSDSWHPPEALVGTWLGKDRIHAPPEKGSPSQIYKDFVTIRVHIASDGRVDGQVGTARFAECKIKSNRGWLGRMLNLWSDYLICDGWLKGPVFRTDRDDAQRPFAIPFGLEGGTLKGRFLLLRKGEKPFSLFFHLELEKQPLTPAQATSATEAKPEKKAGPTDAKPADGTKPAQKPVANETFMKRGSGTLYLDSATVTSTKDDSIHYLPGYPLLMQRGVVKVRRS